MLLSKKLGILALLVLSQLALFASASLASDDDDYNFSWLDPEKKIYVLQNRKYRKADGPHLYLMGGLSGENYRQAYQVQPRAAFWFNEDFGLEVFYTARFNVQNNSYRALDQSINSGGVVNSPYIREIKSQIGVLFNWAPWYAKINVFNSILYFDWYFSFGVGTMNTEIGPKTKDDPVAGPSWKTESLFAVYLGTGHLFHVSEKFMIRLEALGHFYSAPIFGGLPGAPTDSAIFSNLTYNIGVGLRL